MSGDRYVTYQVSITDKETGETRIAPMDGLDWDEWSLYMWQDEDALNPASKCD